MKRPTDYSPRSGTLGALAIASLSLVLAACNAAPLLQTGSLAPTAAEAPPKPATSVDRALSVAATSARAQKCGYYFDPNGLRANFLAAETQRGTTPDQRIFTGSLQELPDLVAREEIRPPTLLIVGEVIKLREKLTWYHSAAEAVSERSDEPAGS